MKKQAVELIDPMTVNWPREAFKVGDEVMVKPYEWDYASRHGLDPEKPLVIAGDDGDADDSAPLWVGDQDAWFDTHELVPISKIQEYEAAKAGKKPMATPKPPKPTICEKALADAKEKVRKAQEHEAGIKRIMELDAALKANKADGAKLVKERVDLAKKHLKGAGNGK